MEKQLSADQRTKILKILQIRFEKNTLKHPDLEWLKIQHKLENADL